MNKRRSLQGLPDNSFGVAAVVFGILSIMFYLYEGIILGIIGLIFALKQRTIINNKWAFYALILSIIGIVFSITSIILGYPSVGSNILPQASSVN